MSSALLYHPAHKIYLALGPSIPLAIYYRELQPVDTASTALQAAAQSLEIRSSCQGRAGTGTNPVEPIEPHLQHSEK